jgi:hypothetical protein
MRLPRSLRVVTDIIETTVSGGAKVKRRDDAIHL